MGLEKKRHENLWTFYGPTVLFVQRSRRGCAIQRMHVIHVPAHDVIIHLLYISRGKATKIVVDIKVYFKTRRTIILTNDGECIT